jgi:hypothetical protein
MILSVVDSNPILVLIRVLIYIIQHTPWYVWLGIVLFKFFSYVYKESEKDSAKKARKAELELQLNDVESKIKQLVSDSLSEDKIIRSSEIEDSVVTCGNGGHRHSYKSFEYAFGNTMDFTLDATSVAKSTSSTGTTSVDGRVVSRTDVHGQSHVPQIAHTGSSQIVTRRGCPTCKSDLFEFERSYLRQYTPCEMSAWKSYTWVIPSHWKLKYEACPICTSSLLTRRVDIKSQISLLDSST